MDWVKKLNGPEYSKYFWHGDIIRCRKYGNMFQMELRSTDSRRGGFVYEEIYGEDEKFGFFLRSHNNDGPARIWLPSDCTPTLSKWWFWHGKECLNEQDYLSRKSGKKENNLDLQVPKKISSAKIRLGPKN